jgi:thiol-disulfide isomerase/thioredoxin
MKRFLFALVAIASLLTSCGVEKGVKSTTISGRFVGSNIDSVYLERVADNFTTPERVGASALSDNGGFSFTLDLEEGASPRFYKLTFPNNGRAVTLVVAPGDQIELESAGDIFLNYEVTGSEESALIREFNREYFAACDMLARIAENLGTGVYTEREAYRYAQQAIQAQVRFVGSHQENLAAFYAMRHNIPENYIPQLNGYGINIVHYRSVLEGLSKRYPNSPYIAILEREIADAEALADLADRVEVASFPDIELKDMYKVSHKLSSLNGKVVLLYFWTLESALCNNINAELKELYAKYHDDGFEVYHVAADGDEAVWIEAVRQQGHPWISVFAGNNPEVFSLYNVARLPMAYIIDREGNMTIGALDMETLEGKLRRLL